MSTDLTKIAEVIAKPNAVALLEKIANGNGGKIQYRGRERRLSRAIVSIRGVEIAAEYLVDGAFLSATETDPAEFPECDLKRAEIGGVDVTWLLEGTTTWDEITQAVEAGWK